MIYRIEQKGRAMRGALKSTITVGAMVMALLVLPARAGDLIDSEMCRNLVQENQLGLTIAYLPPLGSRKVLLRNDHEPTPYSQLARLYFVAGESGRPMIAGKASAWHVRTQTTARAQLSANDVLVYRPSVSNGCSDNSILNAFDLNSRFVEINRYIDHHSDFDRREDTGLSTNFHFALPKNPQSKDCYHTDDPRYVGSLQEQYGFKGLTRKSGRLARRTSIARSAEAGQEITQAGLSSELAYIAAGDAVCFPITVPLPTQSSLASRVFWFIRDSEARRQALTWEPDRTLVVIHRVPDGGKERITIKWQD
jgi:hypothetical protein